MDGSFEEGATAALPLFGGDIEVAIVAGFALVGGARHVFELVSLDAIGLGDFVKRVARGCFSASCAAGDEEKETQGAELLEEFSSCLESCGHGYPPAWFEVHIDVHRSLGLCTKAAEPALIWVKGTLLYGFAFSARRHA